MVVLLMMKTFFTLRSEGRGGGHQFIQTIKKLIHSLKEKSIPRKGSIMILCHTRTFLIWTIFSGSVCIKVRFVMKISYEKIPNHYIIILSQVPKTNSPFLNFQNNNHLCIVRVKMENDSYDLVYILHYLFFIVY